MARKQAAPFHNPFRDPSLRRSLQAAVVAEPKPSAPPKTRGRPISQPQQLGPVDAALLWEEAVRGATPLHGNTPYTPRRVERPDRPDADEEAFEELARFVQGEGRFSLWDQDEFVDGSPGLLGAPLLEKLKRGEFSVQAWVDLHGLLVEEAKEELTRFFHHARLQGFRCVLLVHGRGLHSKDGIPILKERIVGWLSHGRFSRAVLAFCTARRPDGGPGALYVLLRTRAEMQHSRRRRRRKTAV